jgi:hypothetical protein
VPPESGGHPEPPIPEFVDLGLRAAGGRSSRGAIAMFPRSWSPASGPSADPPSLSATNALLPVATAFPFLTP